MDVLILVDIQNDFVPNGALAVAEGDQIVPIVNELQEQFPWIVATQDWHPADHGSFAANHIDQTPGQVIDLHGLSQVLWPVHCVQESSGAEFVEGLDRSSWDQVFQKGTDPKIDSYSGFFDNGQRKSTGLGEYLQRGSAKRVFVVGLATDYCVKFTALDSLKLGFETFVIEDATRSVNLQPGDHEAALAEIRAAGGKVIHSSEVANIRSVHL
ncbi:bifunctional nicotinamidase/pyrazinamidase [Pontibacter sp. G13]|uniref:bifunctional nicotinamidase/pyrazinamidase n=1 Tax=Pontibacter sp. G13 TaxID=3074898 RepID=UPI002888FCFC|nr:bifunctional nicotinamidase/pyrazinamidase [Pontibacter sp. G13]WNJ16829.1 bifunctional nicotinamidase/pyrazinamidase [Pontibacter sp. G13]